MRVLFCRPYSAAVLALALACSWVAPVAWAGQLTQAAAEAAGKKTPAAFSQASAWRYRVSTAYFGDGITRAQMQFQPLTGQSYRASLSVSVAGQTLLHMQTQGQRSGTGRQAHLQAQRFQERVFGSNKSVWQERGEAVFPQTQQRYRLPALAIDSVSIHYQLQQWLASGAMPAQAGAYRDVWLMRPEGIFHWRYAVQGWQSLNIEGLGPVQALHIVPQALGKGTAKSELWFAPSLGWAPVRIRMQLLDKSWVEMNWMLPPEDLTLKK